MARRSSARLQNRKSSTPKRVSLSHDAVSSRTPRTAPVKLSTLREDGDMPGAFPNSASPPSRDSSNNINKHTTKIPVKFYNITPTQDTPAKPAEEEMHPKHYQHSTAKRLEEARWLGFSGLAPYTEPPKPASKIAPLQGTPTRAAKSSDVVGSPRFQFTFGREVSLELSPEAKKLMNDKREEALRIREQMIANGEGPKGVAEAVQRKIATPKGKKGRFSEVHMENFKKMDSIAGHASAFRADTTKSKTNTSPIRSQTEEQTSLQSGPSPTKSLKRSPSKAQLDEPNHAQLPQSISKPKLVHTHSHLPRSASSKSLLDRNATDEPSPTKRFKRSEADDMSKARPPSNDTEKPLPATPHGKKTIDKEMQDAVTPTFNSPTHASLARASSIKSVKSSRIPEPTLFGSPGKLLVQSGESPKPSTPLLARSPTKVSLFSYPSVKEAERKMSPLLMRTPSKASPIKKLTVPEKPEGEKPKEAPLLARTPLKMSVAKNAESEVAQEKPTPSIPLLTRSPAKFTLPKADADFPSNQTSPAAKSTSSGIAGRFNLLRSSPMKSILRSPQRLYSNDPAKVAAGTHLASPASAVTSQMKGFCAVKEETPSIEKHVDFTSSTKARYERAQSEASSTPSKGPTPPPKVGTEATSSPKVLYPTLPSDEAATVVTPQKRRQTAAPYDFTFTSHGTGIVFSQSPNAPASAANSKRPSTIRQVSTEPQLPPLLAPATGSKKRKFDFENDKAVVAEAGGQLSDKENACDEETDRPTKRVKPNAPEQPATKAVTRVPTLGVKPKKTISKARLNALAQPKRRP